jgi:hypothetical protein
MTPDEADARSMGRAKMNRARLYVLGGFVLVAMFTGAGLLQYQQRQLADLIDEQAVAAHQMCISRQVNTLKSNANWAALAVIERHNKFIDDKLRNERLAVYENAKLIVPDCEF